MSISEIIEGLSYNERRLLLALESAGDGLSPAELVSKGGFELEVEVMGAASWLASKGLVVIDEDVSKFFVVADTTVVENGLPERKAIKAIDAAGGKMDMSAFAEALPDGEDKIAVGWLKRKKLADIVKDGDAKILVLTDLGKDMLAGRMEDEVLLERMAQGPLPEADADARIIKDLKGRQGMVAEDIVTKRTVSLTAAGTDAISVGI